MSVEEGAPPTQGYLHACQRAELLGLPTPSEAEWLESDEYAQEREALENEQHDTAVAQELESNDDSMKGIAGGLDELNVILNATQKRINKFKNVCGSLGTLLKARVSSQPGTPEHRNNAGSSEAQSSMSAEEAEAPGEEPEAPVDGEDDGRQRIATGRKQDLNQKMGSHIDKLDSLINKAENAQYSMQHQTKQMKSFLK